MVKIILMGLVLRHGVIKVGRTRSISWIIQLWTTQVQHNGTRWSSRWIHLGYKDGSLVLLYKRSHDRRGPRTLEIFLGNLYTAFFIKYIRNLKIKEKEGWTPWRAYIPPVILTVRVFMSWTFGPPIWRAKWIHHVIIEKYMVWPPISFDN